MIKGKKEWPVDVYYFPEAERIAAGLVKYAMKLYARWPDASGGVAKEGWMSAIGQFEHKKSGCEQLTELKAFVRPLLPEYCQWDLLSHFNILWPGGELLPHTHWENQFVAIYHVQGEGELVVGSKRVETKPGRLAIFHGIAEHHVPKAESARISVSINCRMVVKQGKANELLGALRK